jgi:hypothetical protein
VFPERVTDLLMVGQYWTPIYPSIGSLLHADLHVLTRLQSGGLSGSRAALLLGVSPRRVRRMAAAYAIAGMASIPHGNREKRPHNAIDPDVVARIRKLAILVESEQRVIADTFEMLVVSGCRGLCSPSCPSLGKPASLRRR